MGAAASVNRVQLPHLETFVMAAEIGSCTKAAKVLRVTQAAVSQRIHATETALATALFQRQGGRVLLTEAGRKLHDYAERILDLHRAAREEITGHEAAPAAELFLGASSIPGEHLLPTILAAFRQVKPHILVHTSVSDSVAVIGQVERGEVSLGLVGRKADKANLQFRFLTQDRLVLVVPAGHALSKRKKISVRQLLKHPIVLREAGSGMRHCFEKSLERAGYSSGDLRVAMELGSNEAVKQAVMRGAGVAVLSVYAVQREMTGGQLHAVELSDLRCERDLYLVQNTRRALSLPARLFLIFLETHPLVVEAP